MSINACSSSDDDGGSAGGTITAKINGVSKTFNTVVVDEDTYTEGGVSYTDLTVTATIGTSTTEVITFYLSQEEVGADAIWNFMYLKDGASYYDSSSFSSVVTTNTANGRLKGNFSGTLEGANPLVITDGSFDINY